ncbi:DUF6087 family protein [Kitasatospora sp. NPDC086791]|uniref:DUF6087 family protein n=1 Tax=Kitasatospora sp. NPDC086791 TaxID=3155178 RepID=UPI00343288A7
MVWQPVGIAADYSEAYPLIMRRDGGLIEPQDDTPVALLRKGSGRHRRPFPPNGRRSRVEPLGAGPRSGVGAGGEGAAAAGGFVRLADGGGVQRVSGWGRRWGCGTVGVDFP